MYNWHQRLRHLHYSAFREESKATTGVVFLEDGQVETECEACVREKMQRLPFKGHFADSKESGDIVHSDLCRPMPVESFGKARYFVTFIDEYTSYCCVHPMVREGQLKGVFINYCTEFERKFGKKVKGVHFDNGGE